MTVIALIPLSNEAGSHSPNAIATSANSIVAKVRAPIEIPALIPAIGPLSLATPSTRAENNEISPANIPTAHRPL